MNFYIGAVCACNTGNTRINNEDNLFFDGKCLDIENNGLERPICFYKKLRHGLNLAVFDGMGGESFGELASFTAACFMQINRENLLLRFVEGEKYLRDLCVRINRKVFDAAKKHQTGRMGTTVATLHFSAKTAFACNIGDSRIYLFREGASQQLSHDHVMYIGGGSAQRKPPLTRYLGMDPDRYLVEPHIVRSTLNRGDIYLICSDGLTDMLTDDELCGIIYKPVEINRIADELMGAALAKGGTDNVTFILCRIF